MDLSAHVRYLEIDDDVVAYTHLITDPSNPTLLLIHGIGSEQGTWNLLADHLQTAGHNLITFDLPGHGASRGRAGQHNIEHYADLAARVAWSCGVERFHLVGHSLGGGVSLTLTRSHPHLWSSMTLIASGGLGHTTTPALRLAALPGADRALGLAVNPVTVGSLKLLGAGLGRIGRRPYQLTDTPIELVDRLRDRGHRDAFLETLHDVVDIHGQRKSALDSLDQIPGERVLLIWGEHDPVIPRGHGLRAHEALRGSRMHTVAGTTHEPHRSDPRTVAGLIDQHVRSHS